MSVNQIAGHLNKRGILRLIRTQFEGVYVNEIIMMVITASNHRIEAFQAAEFLMDYLKSRAPFWKKEYTESGGNWVDSKEVDELALKRW